MARRIRFNGFAMHCAVHQSPGLWRHPDDQSWRCNELGYWVELAQLLEAGRFDGLFLADVLGTYDLYGSGNEAALRQGVQVPVGDPLLLVPAMAHHTEHLGFGITVNIGFEHPYPFARRMSTLDHLTGGRVGWNVVTGYLASGARNLGLEDQLSHDERYDLADEYLDVVYRLWEGSWEDGAVVRDREAGVFVDPSKVHDIDHRGRWFQVPGIHLCEPSPQRTPVIYQAGASPRGREFAAQHAEAIFTGVSNRRALAQLVDDLRGRVDDAGRDPYSVRIYNLHGIVTDATTEGAEAKLAQYRSWASAEGALVLLSGWLGVDLSALPLDEPIEHIDTQGLQSAAAAVVDAARRGQALTVRELAQRGCLGGTGAHSVGSGVAVADDLQGWVEETDVDGFNLAYLISPGTFRDVIDHVVPELQRRGAYPLQYEPGTLRHKLFGCGDRLPASHRGARHRR